LKLINVNIIDKTMQEFTTWLMDQLRKKSIAHGSAMKLCKELGYSENYMYQIYRRKPFVAALTMYKEILRYENEQLRRETER
jgi:hypothetical protein